MSSIAKFTIWIFFISGIIQAAENKKKAESTASAEVAALLKSEQQASPNTAGSDWQVSPDDCEDDCEPFDDAKKKSDELIRKYFPKDFDQTQLKKFQEASHAELDQISRKNCGEVPKHSALLVPFQIYHQSGIQVPVDHAKKQIKAFLSAECKRRSMNKLFDTLYLQAKEQLNSKALNGFLPVAFTKSIPEEILKKVKISSVSITVPTLHTISE